MENEERKRCRFPGYDMEAIGNTYKCLRGLHHWHVGRLCSVLI